MNYVDLSTGENPPSKMKVNNNAIELSGYSVAVVECNR